MTLNDADSKKLGLVNAILCEILTVPDQVWDAQFQFRINKKVVKNDVLLVRFYARTVAPNQEGVIRVIFEQTDPPHEKSLSRDVVLDTSWKEFVFPFHAQDTYEPQKASVGFHLGLQEQTVEIADLTLDSYGQEVDFDQLPCTPLTYAGRDPDAVWRQEAEQRIEQIRKGDLRVTVRDARGKPIVGADVLVRMKRHAFGWGSAVVADRILQNDEDGRKYRQIVEENFNRVVFENDMKWSNWENLSNKARTLKAVKWLRDRNIDIRGHCLVWPSWKQTPEDLKQLRSDSEQLRTRINRHIVDEVTALKGQLVDWDVVNEPYTNNEILRELGEPEMVKWFELAHKCDPGVNLYLNEYSLLSSGGRDRRHQDYVEKTLLFLKEQGVPVHGLGMQGHFYETPTSPERMLEILDRFGKLGLDIMITEFDVLPGDSTFQADFTRDVLTTAFSHPSVVGVLNWGFWEKSHWLPSAAQYRADWSITPHGQVWVDLVKKRWWTDVDGKTDAQGQFSTRGFLGDYEITVRKGSRSRTVHTVLSKTGTQVEVVLE
ncbi:MAG: endo-1,4-beta-xylanase [Thermoguttaceae bacterium]